MGGTAGGAAGLLAGPIEAAVGRAAGLVGVAGSRAAGPVGVAFGGPTGLSSGVAVLGVSEGGEAEGAAAASLEFAVRGCG